MTPEQLARQKIDQMLEKAGWVIQDMKRLNPRVGKGGGVAVREFPTDTGPVDYMFLLDGKAVGVLEAKKETALLRTSAEEQSARYARSSFRWKKDDAVLPFVYESTGAMTHFTDMRDPRPRSREVFAFHRPATMRAWLRKPLPLRQRLINFPPLDESGLRKCQINAIRNLEGSFSENRPRALVQMATGSGKTFTAITSIYRLLKPPINAKRILFLVDTRNLGEQAEQAFQAYIPQDDQRTFTKIYNTRRLQGRSILDSDQV